MSTFVVRALWGDVGGADAKARTHYLYIRRCSIYKASFRRSNGRRAACRCGVGARRREGAADGGGAAAPIAERISTAHPAGERKQERACRSAGGEANPFVGKRDQVLFVERADGAFERLLRHFETLGDDFRLTAVGEG